MCIGNHAPIISSRAYEEAKQAMAKAVSENNKNRIYPKYVRRKLITEEQKIKRANIMRETMKNVPKSESHRKKLSELATGHTHNPEGHNGEGFTNHKHSEESRKKISENHADITGEKNPFFGKHHTKESSKKISESLLGKKRAPYKIVNRKGKKRGPYKKRNK